MLIRHAFRRRVGVALVALSMGTLVGCTSGSLPPTERPEVVWADGEPSGSLENDPWVQAVRASDLELGIALNTRDFATHALAETSTLEVSSGLLASVERAAESEKWFYSPGPTPMVPIHVEEAADGTSATVYSCRVADWTISADRSKPERPLEGRFIKLDLVMEDDHRKVDQSAILDDLDGVTYLLGEDVVAPFLDDREGSDCDLDDAKIGLFDPQPDVTVEYAPEDIRTPAEE